MTFPKDNFPGSGFIVDGYLLKGNTKFAGEVSFSAVRSLQQLANIRSEKGFLPLAVKTLASIIAIINPVSIMLTGNLIEPTHIEEIRKGCLRDIPEEHMPQIFLKRDTPSDYMAGRPYKAMGEELLGERQHAKDILFDFNQLRPSAIEERNALSSGCGVIFSLNHQGLPLLCEYENVQRTLYFPSFFVHILINSDFAPTRFTLAYH
ncbi:hypothetical protein J2T18_004677 [Paenibacillus polymyxa]|uniref:maltose acetyltransferase domain-containing protein n=1 Tax=Paenibacillus polymyxa TaxID=1406 RepID=UPI00278EEA0D|nr:maltose acetyltransferase domain-containing protein [Paenibacillus polymyxa]MDQ0050338.1 hypothetical protein [Paenibacillus polymyxa]